MMRAILSCLAGVLLWAVSAGSAPAQDRKTPDGSAPVQDKKARDKEETVARASGITSTDEVRAPVPEFVVAFLITALILTVVCMPSRKR